MYSVLVKKHIDGQGYEQYGNLYDIKNAEEKAIDLVVSLIGYFKGYEVMDDYFLKKHPTSTINTPRFYCIPGLDVFRVYKHSKINGWIFSEHVYEKEYTIKIVKSCDYVYPGNINNEIKYRTFNKRTYWNARIENNTIKNMEDIIKNISPTNNESTPIHGSPIKKLLMSVRNSITNDTCELSEASEVENNNKEPHLGKPLCV